MNGKEGQNPMRSIRVEKVTVNMGMGGPGEEMEKAREIMQRITGAKPVATKAKSRLPTWNIRPGLEIGLKTTLRGKPAEEFLRKALAAKENTLNPKNFDRTGNFAFGIKEYIDIPGSKYDPKLGIRGLDVLVTLERPGFRVKKRKLKNAKVGARHRISKDEAVQFMESHFGLKVSA